jgi:hypothetical protein
MSRESFSTRYDHDESAKSAGASQVDNGSLESWGVLSKRLKRLAQPKHMQKMFGDSETKVGIYLWGVAAAYGRQCGRLLTSLAELSMEKPKASATERNNENGIDFDREAAAFMDLIETTRVFSPADCHLAILWAAALPALESRIEAHRWWRLLSALKQLHESVMQRNATYQVEHLMLAGELGLTLAWRTRCIAACQRLANNAGESVRQWGDQEHEAVSGVLANAANVRLVLASLIRCHRLLEKVAKRKLRKSDHRTMALLAQWAAALTHPLGTAFSEATVQEMSADNGEHGLIDTLRHEHAELLGSGLAAACGESPLGGRLAWEVGLPETWHHDRDAKLAVGFPEWDVRQGRFHLDYSSENPKLELFAGRRRVFSGEVQIRLEVDGVEQRPVGTWNEVCEHSDDDVHYLEIEQSWSGQIVLQRQLMLVRDDRCLLMADSVLPQNPDSGAASAGADAGDLAIGAADITTAGIHYWCNFPLAGSMVWAPEQDTREGFLADGKNRALVVPLAAGEWTAGQTDSSICQTSDRHLQLFARGRKALYAPLWLDFQKRRFLRPRTWRQLTVGDQLKLVPRHDAAAYRIQAGSEQWMIYRSMGERRSRTMLGKHLIAEFYGSRFYPGDGSHEELVTVDDKCSADDE